MPSVRTLFSSLGSLRDANRARAAFDDPGRKLTAVFPPEPIRPDSTVGLSLLLRVPTDSGGDVIALIHVPASGTGVIVLVINPATTVEAGASLGELIDESGWPVAVAVVEDILGMRVDHVMSLDIEALAGIVDRLGPLAVYSAVAFSTAAGEFVVGTNHLDGVRARAFVAADPIDDAGQTRTRSQRALLRSLLAALDLGRPAKDPQELVGLFSLLAAGSRTDAGLTTSVLAGLPGRLRGLSPVNILTVTLPTTSRRDESGHVIVDVDVEAVPVLREALAGDDPIGFVRGLASLGY